MSSALSRAEIGLAGLGDDGVEGGFIIGCGGISASSMVIESAAITGSGGDGEEEKASKGGLEMA